MQVLHQHNSVWDCILWFILFSKILFSLLFAVLSSNDVSPRTPWPQEGPLMSPLSTVGGLWGVLSGVCQNSPLCLKTDPTRVLFQAASTLLTNADLRKCFSRSNCGFHPKSGLTWDWSVLEKGGGAVGFQGVRRLILSHKDLQEIMLSSVTRRRAWSCLDDAWWWWCCQWWGLIMRILLQTDFWEIMLLVTGDDVYMQIENTCRDLIRYGCLIIPNCGFSYVSSNEQPGRMQSCIDCICLSFLHYVFSNVSLICLPERMHNHIGCICLTFLHCVFSNVSSNCLLERMHSHIDCICLSFLHCGSSNVSSNYLDKRMHSRTVCICLAFLQCGFSNVSSNGLLEKM